MTDPALVARIDQEKAQVDEFLNSLLTLASHAPDTDSTQQFLALCGGLDWLNRNQLVVIAAAAIQRLAHKEQL